MLLGGLWHGAAWTFVGWGLLHGGGLAIERAIDEKSVEHVGKKYFSGYVGGFYTCH